MKSEIPKCCWECQNLEHEQVSDYGATYHFCVKGLIFPTKKKECKKQLYQEQPITVNCIECGCEDRAWANDKETHVCMDCFGAKYFAENEAV